MKKPLMLLSALMALVMLAGCGAPAASSGAGASSGPPQPSTADYRKVIEDARPAELNDIGLYAIVTGPEDDMYDMYFDPAFGFVEEDMARYALSIGTIITIAYGVAIILPAEGREQAVLDQVNAYVESQQKAQENYLPNQYEIAKNAVVKVADSGEVLLAMIENADEVMAKMEAGLKAG